MKSKWTFFTSTLDHEWGEGWVLMASNEKEGILFKANGVYQPDFSNNYCLNEAKRCCQDGYWRMLDFNEAMNLIQPEARDEVMKFLNISSKPIYLTKKKIDELLNLLTQSKAFNGDSAYLAKDKEYGYFEKLAQRKLVLVSPLDDKMFYLKEKNVDKLD